MAATEGTHRWPGGMLSTLYIFIGFILTRLWLVLVLAGTIIGFATTVIWVGLPVLAVVVKLWRGVATAERGLIRGMLKIDIPDPYRPLPEGSWFRRLRARFSDPASWKDLLWILLIAHLLMALWFALVIGTWGIGLTSISLLIWYRYLPHHRFAWIDTGHHRYLVIHNDTQAVWGAAAGIGICLVAYLLASACARAHAAVARGLLGPSERAELYARTVILEETRTRAIAAAEEERRRIERDLHDSTQQRLVALAMDLGRAREKMTTDPAGAQALVDSAHDESKRAIAELRDLVRGIHPAVLVDRGLDAAISALAGRSPVPVEVDARLPDRVDTAVEGVAYFVVAEALTNIAKHAQATRAWVRIEHVSKHLIVEIRDDGRGGATMTPGGGLAGLADRAAGVDGALSVDSPPGGPTVIRMELPCAS